MVRPHPQKRRSGASSGHSSEGGELLSASRREAEAALCCGCEPSGAEPVKAFETRTQDFFCVSVWMVGLLIQATVGSLGGVGRRPQNRRGLAA